MKIRSCLFLIVLLTASMLNAESSFPPKKIPLTSVLYEEMDTLYRLQGVPLPSGSRPWSTQEASLILSAIPADTKFQHLYSTIKERMEQNSLKHVSNHFSYLLTTNLATEAYLHTNPGSFTTSPDWIYAYDQRQPLARFIMELAFSNRFYFATSVDVGASSVTDDDTLPNIEAIGALYPSGEVTYQTMAKQYTDSLASNLLLPSTDKTLADWPMESQFSLGGDWWHLSTGRTRLQWGNGASGNLVVGSHIANHNHLSISFFSEVVKLQFLYLFLPDPTNAEIQRMFMGHRIEAQLNRNLRFTITENIMYKDDSIHIRYLDPTYIYHNLYDSNRLNSIASLELDWAPISGLSLHGQLAIDQFRLANEPDTDANAMGVIFQLAYAWQEQEGYWTATTEYSQTDPVLYRRDKVDFLIARGMHNNWPPVLIDYLGYSYGSDSQVLQTKLSYYRPGLFSAEGSVTIHRQGELTYDKPHHVDSITPDNSNNSEYPNVSGPSPSGDNITERLIVGLAGTCYTDWKNLVLYAQANWIGRRIYQRPTKTYAAEASDLQLVMGMKIRF